MGAGTLTFSYAIKENGIAWGTLLIIFGALISYYTGMLLVTASNHTNRTRYEDIADQLAGKRFAFFTSLMNLLCLISFVMSYIVYVSLHPKSDRATDQSSNPIDHSGLCA